MSLHWFNCERVAPYATNLVLLFPGVCSHVACKTTQRRYFIQMFFWSQEIYVPFIHVGGKRFVFRQRFLIALKEGQGTTSSLSMNEATFSLLWSRHDLKNKKLNTNLPPPTVLESKVELTSGLSQAYDQGTNLKLMGMSTSTPAIHTRVFVLKFSASYGVRK